MIGVYCIINTVTGKRYIGSASRSIKERWALHRRALRRGDHHSTYLQRSWNKYGEAAFEFVVLEECKVEDCINREQYWIDTYTSYASANGYNVSPTAGSPLGVKHSDAARQSMSSATIGKKKSKSHALHIKLAKMSMSQMTKLKMSRYAKNRPKAHKDKLPEKFRGA